MTPCRKDPCRIYDPGGGTASRSSSVRPTRPARRSARCRSSGGSSARELSASGAPRRSAVALALVPGGRAAAPGRRARPGPRPPRQPATEPIGPGSSTRKIKDGGGTRGVVSGLREAELNLRVGAPAALAARARRREGRHDADGDGRHEHRQHRPRADREPRGRGALPAHPRRRLDRPGAAAPTRSTRRSARAGRTTSTWRAGARPASCRRELVAALGFPDRGLQERSDFTGFNWADVPVILVEMGFMTNPTEDRLLATPAYQRRAALGLCRERSASSDARPGCLPLTSSESTPAQSTVPSPANGVLSACR